MLIPIIGLIGVLCLMLCGVPQAIKATREGHSDGVSAALLLLWLFGELATLVYAFAEKKGVILICNYAFGFICVAWITYYKFWPRRPV